MTEYTYQPVRFERFDHPTPEKGRGEDTGPNETVRIHDAGQVTLTRPVAAHYEVTGRTHLTLRGPYEPGLHVNVGGRHAVVTASGHLPGPIHLTGGATGFLLDGASAVAHYGSTAVATLGSWAEIEDGANGFAYCGSHLMVCGGGRGWVGGSGVAEAYKDSNVVALETSRVTAYPGSTVKALSNATVIEISGADVTLGPGAALLRDGYWQTPAAKRPAGPEPLGWLLREGAETLGKGRGASRRIRLWFTPRLGVDLSDVNLHPTLDHLLLDTALNTCGKGIDVEALAGTATTLPASINDLYPVGSATLGLHTGPAPRYAGAGTGAEAPSDTERNHAC